MDDYLQDDLSGKGARIIPTLMEAMESDGENDGLRLLDYYRNCNQMEKSAVNEIFIYLCGYSFETICDQVGYEIDQNGEIIEQDPLG